MEYKCVSHTLDMIIGDLALPLAIATQRALTKTADYPCVISCVLDDIRGDNASLTGCCVASMLYSQCLVFSTQMPSMKYLCIDIPAIESP